MVGEVGKLPRRKHATKLILSPAERKPISCCCWKDNFHPKVTAFHTLQQITGSLKVHKGLPHNYYIC
jgi:hypothetical protein